MTLTTDPRTLYPVTTSSKRLAEETLIESVESTAIRSDRLRNDTFNAYRARIEMLKGDAEDEGIDFNDTSEQDFWEFMRSVPYTLKADIVVTDSGNLRAVWRGDGVKHVGLQFLGGRWIEYVMWTRRTGSMNTSTKAGRDTFEGVKEQIRASSLASFLQ